MTQRYSITARVWKTLGNAAWYFVTIPAKQGSDIDFYFSHAKRGWGSLPVTIKLGKTEWKTSIFPDKKAGSYWLPLKADVRKQEIVHENDKITFVMEVTA